MEMGFETIAALIAFAALVIVWAFAPTSPAVEPAPAPVAAHKVTA
jgi:hypothetical protein